MYKIIVQNTNTVLQDTSIQYSITMFGNQARYLSWSVPGINLMFFYFLFQIICNTFFFKSMLFTVQMTLKLFKLTRKNQQGKVLHFLLPKDRNIQQWDAEVKLLVSIDKKDIGARVFGKTYSFFKNKNENENKKYILFLRNLAIRQLKIMRRWVGVYLVLWYTNTLFIWVKTSFYSEL